MKTIRLPKSGLTLEPGETIYTLYSEELGTIAQIRADEGADWEAHIVSGDTNVGTFEECCAWIDDQLLALRAALTPGDSVAEPRA